MSDQAERAALLGLRLTLDFLEQRTGQTAVFDTPVRVSDLDAWTATGTLGERRLTVAVAFVVPPAGAGAWYQAKEALERRIGDGLPGGHILWCPSGADLPGREPGRSDIIQRVEELAGRLVPGGHGEVRFPVTLHVRKSDEEGSYLTARGGLASVWAQFTGRVSGHYQLDSTELFRLPRGEGYVSTLVDRIVEAAGTLGLGQSAAIETEDAWTLQRLNAGEGLTIIGEPPGADLSSGAPLRRNLRRLVPALRAPLLLEAADARVVAVIGPYAGTLDQPAGTALLGMDPTLYTGMDLMLLAADGDVRPILDLTRSPVLAAREDGPRASEGWGVGQG